jgi:sulfur-carrier protein adenylyltransferase/sulfurtransferase
MSDGFARLNVQDTKKKLDAGWAPFVLDVRKPPEAAISKLDFADMLRPHEAILAGDLSGIPADRPVLVQCRSGGRSAMVARVLVANGWTDVTNLEGGINAWATEIDTSLQTY